MLTRHAHHLTVALARYLRQVRPNFADLAHDEMDAALDLALVNDENLLTGAIFTRLRYLDAPLVRDVVVGACRPLLGVLPSIPTQEGFTVELWPGLRDGERRVEPDAVMSFGSVVIGVEVKWHDEQTGEQIEAERAALAARHEGATVVMLALGGSPDKIDLAKVGGTLLFLSWKALASRVEVLRQRHAHEPAGLVLEDVRWFLERRDPFLVRPPSVPGKLECPVRVEYDAAWFCTWGPELLGKPQCDGIVQYKPTWFQSWS